VSIRHQGKVGWCGVVLCVDQSASQGMQLVLREIPPHLWWVKERSQPLWPGPSQCSASAPQMCGWPPVFKLTTQQAPVQKQPCLL
jgi:hypothetical protein